MGGFGESRLKRIITVLTSFGLVVTFVVSELKQLKTNELFDFIKSATTDRWNAQEHPSIWPRVVSLSEKQRFYIYAPNSSTASIKWTQSSSASEATHLGFGLHEIDFDPRDATLKNARTGDAQINLILDEQIYTRSVRVIRPRISPKLTDSLPSNGVAVGISSQTDEVMIIRRNGNFLRRSVMDSPADAVFIDRKSSIALSHQRSPEIWILESRKGDRLKQIRALGPQGKLAVSPDRKYLAAVILGNQPGIQIFQLPELSSSLFITLDSAPNWIEFGKNSDLILSARKNSNKIEQIQRTGATWNKGAKSLTLDRPPYSLSLSQDRRILSALVSDHRPNEDSSSNHRINAQEIQINVEDLKVINQLPTFNSKLLEPNSRSHGANPRAVRYAEKTKRAITFAGTNELWLVETSSLSGTSVTSLRTPVAGPDSLTYLGADVWAISHPSSGTINLTHESGRTLKSYELETDADLHESDPNALRIRTGERYFQETTRKGVACQSCHENTDSDYSKHDIGGGISKPTLSIRGIAFSAPFLRSGSYPDIESLEHVVLEILGGYERKSKNRGARIQYFLESLIRPQPVKTISLQDKQAGLEAFVKAGCESCHSFPAFTNLEQVSATYLFPDQYQEFGWLDTPTLLSVGTSAPYLADGRADSLASVISEHNVKNRHGNTQILSKTEKKALIAFLESL
ncbi:MAG: hypothetical protein VYC39_07405 [Myxococcota bacterium]|nr:hypothetical protein [Myxococcota bacterium]